MEQKDLPLFNQFAEEERPAAATNKTVPSSDRPFGKYIVYVDESGDHSMVSIDKSYPIFVLAFCIFHKRHYGEKVVPALEAFKFKHFGHDQVVLHEHEIRKEKGAFSFFPNRAAKNAFLNDLTTIVEDSNFILASCVIDKQRLRKITETPDNPYHIALMHCIFSLYDFLVEKEEHEQLTHVVVERRGAKEDKELELEFRRICDGNNSRGIQLPFEILFADKKAMSSGLQVADLVARPVGLRILRPEQPNRSFDVLKHKFYCKGGRPKVGEDFDGWGLKIVPSIKSEGPR
jgi:hypothetical protein